MCSPPRCTRGGCRLGKLGKGSGVRRLSPDAVPRSAEKREAVGGPGSDPASRPCKTCSSRRGCFHVYATASLVEPSPIHALLEEIGRPLGAFDAGVDVTWRLLRYLFPLFPLIGTVPCALLHMRSRSKEGIRLGKLHGALSRLSNMLPIRDKSSVSPESLSSSSLFALLSRHCDARQTLRGRLVPSRATRRQMGISTSLPRLLCVSCSTGVCF